MRLRSCYFLALFLWPLTFFAQDILYSSLTIPQELTKNANALIRLSDVKVDIKSIDEMIETERRIVTVFNGKGDEAVGAQVYYDDDTKVRSIQALVFDKFGNQIEKFKKNDFNDVSAVDGGTLYSDSRILYLDYTPISYPYTVEFTVETFTHNTAFISSFTPVRAYYVGAQECRHSINYPDNMTLRFLEQNLESYEVEKSSTENYKTIYSIKNIQPFEPESYSPSFRNLVPKVLFATDEFNYEGVKGEASNWKDFGKWVYENMIRGANDLPDSTKLEIQDLVKNEKTDIEKAKKIYQYVQDKVRYISVQVGIGGWRPYSSSYVDRLSYGDCKALTNYTMSLLDAVGIESYFTLLFAGNSQRDITEDFTIMQANHAILSIPNSNETIWLECTSQSLPFGFIGDFTDDRDVLVITPEGGLIKHTKKYTVDENSQILKGSYTLTKDGAISAELKMSSKGIQYDDKYRISTYDKRDKDLTYKKRWRYINGLSIEQMDIQNDKDSMQFNEHIKFNADGYCKKAGNRLLFSVNALNRNRYVPDRYRNRKLPVKVKRGFIDKDEVTVFLPNGYAIESLPKNSTIENKFGSYKTEIIKQNDSTILFKREFKLNDGEYPKEDYVAFREFYKSVSKLDNSKIALIQN
ncbi:MAG: DUF3857 domain-containing protein [Jejuia sp.]